MQLINSQIRAFLKENPSEGALTDFINHLVPKVAPTLKFHELDLKSLKQPVLVFAHLMIQDIRDSFYYYSFIMKRPFQVDDKFMLYRWGNKPEQDSEDALESQQYLKVMLERDPVICTQVLGLTEWAQKLEGHVQQIELMIDHKCQFKLGEVIDIVGFYYPDHQKMYFVRKATEEEIQKYQLNPLKLMAKAQVNFELIRQELMSWLCSYCSESFSEFLLLCLLSEEPFFLGAQADVSPLIETIYPRVKHLKLVYPCQESLFPFKNQEGEMMIAPLQLSVQPTFVSVDLSAFSQKNIVQIGQKTIDNFKALKVFVEENKTIYRWQYGESLLDHCHRGIVVKAASFINPRFHPKDQAISQDFSTLAKVEPEKLQQFRTYIAAVQTVSPVLSQQERVKIQEILKEEQQKQKIGQKLADIMALSKLLARSYGRSEIKAEDFKRSQWLINQQVQPKPPQ